MATPLFILYTRYDLSYVLFLEGILIFDGLAVVVLVVVTLLSSPGL